MSVGPQLSTKSFDSASNSILSDGPTGYVTNRSSCSANFLLFGAVSQLDDLSKKDYSVNHLWVSKGKSV